MAYKYRANEYDAESGFQIPPVGPCRVRIEEASEKVSKNSGNPMMEVICKVLTGPGVNSRLWQYIVYNDYATRAFGDIIRACGMDPSVDRNITPELLVGLTGEVQVKHEVTDGQTRAKIGYWRKPDPDHVSDIPYDEAVTDIAEDGTVTRHKKDDDEIPF